MEIIYIYAFVIFKTFSKRLFRKIHNIYCIVQNWQWLLYFIIAIKQFIVCIFFFSYFNTATPSFRVTSLYVNIYDMGFALIAFASI